MLIEEDLKRWREGFRAFVRANGNLAWHDPSDNDIAFDDDGSPLWNEEDCIFEADGEIGVRVRVDNIVTEEEERRIGRMLRKFAVSMGVYRVYEIGMSVVRGDDADYDIVAETALCDMEIPCLAGRYEDQDAWWIIGDAAKHTFLHFKEYDGSAIETSDPMDAERYDTYEDAARAMWKDDEVLFWIDQFPDGFSFSPLKIASLVSVRRPSREEIASVQKIQV